MSQDKQTDLHFTSTLDTEEVAGEVDRFVQLVKMNRKGFERRWYDNNFFDDGYHFRYVSRTTGRIVDQNEKNLAFAPNRAIPKASKQIRGVANLLLKFEPTPTIYPDFISKTTYPDISTANLPPDVQQMLAQKANGQLPPSVENPAYTKAQDSAKKEAQQKGAWVEHEWEKQELKDKLVQMVILAAKHGISFIQVWPDHTKEQIRTKVYDAFDIWIMGQYDDLEDEPMIVKTASRLISDLRNNEMFDEDQRLKLSADNKFATSEIKQAYMQSRFGSGMPVDSVATLQLREAFIKEPLTSANAIKVAKDLGEDFKQIEAGDTVIRQIFTAGGVWLYDKYTALTRYPFAEFRFEPGPLYQVPLIERFIPANKSLDILMSRLERYSNTMGVGVIMKRKGENYKITNSSSAQEIEYETSAPVQMPLQGAPASMFELINLLERNIEEQGASVSTLNQIPTGVRSGDAIETLKASEYDNLKIPTDQMKRTVKHITERMFDIAANHFIQPQTVYQMNKGKSDYFQVVGEVGQKARKKAKMDSMDGVVIKKDTRIKIEIESGIGFTEAGKKQTMQEIIKFMDTMMQQGLVTKQAMSIITEKFLEIYHFGSTQEFMEALESGEPIDGMKDDQIMQMKVAMLEAMKDTGVVGPQADQKLVDSTKVGVLEALQQSGLAKNMATPQPAKETVSINYKDAPEDVKRQMEREAGFQPSQTLSPSGSDQIVKHTNTNQSALKAQRQHALEVMQLAQQQAQAQKENQLQQQQLNQSQANQTEGGANGNG